MQKPTTKPAVTTKTIKIEFGMLSDTILKQLTKQGFKFDLEEIEDFDQDKNALVALYASDLLTDKQHKDIKEKLYKRILKHVCKVNKFKVNSVNTKK